MAKLLKDIIGSKRATSKKTNDLGGYAPKAGDEQDFAQKHEIEVTADVNGNGDDVFKGTNVKFSLANPKEKHHGNTPAKAKAANEETDPGFSESKKAEDISCNHTPAGTKCPMHEMADCTAAKTIKESGGSPANFKTMKPETRKHWREMKRLSDAKKKAAKQPPMSKDDLRRMAADAVKNTASMQKEEVVDEAMSIKQKQHSNRVKTMPGKKGNVMAKSNFEAPHHKVHATVSKGDGPKELHKHEIQAKDKHDAMFNVQMMHHKAGHKVHDTKYKGLVKEEIEQIDELSPATLNSYKSKAASSEAEHSDKQSSMNIPAKQRNMHSLKAHSRRQGMKLASKKLGEEAIDELSKDTLGNYIKSASADVGHKKADAAYSRMSGNDKLADRHTDKARKRLGGIYTAANKLTREETVEEGANVDRMVAHIKSSEKAAGKSDKKAENIAWATANKRGMLDNKNKKIKEDLAMPLLGGDQPPRGESDEAIEMVKAELKALANKAMHLVMQMPQGMHVEPWCQAKIAQAKSYVSDVHDYMVYGDHKDEEDESDTPMDITTAGNPTNSYPSFSADVNTGRNV